MKMGINMRIYPIDLLSYSIVMVSTMREKAQPLEDQLTSVVSCSKPHEGSSREINTKYGIVREPIEKIFGGTSKQSSHGTTPLLSVSQRLK